jgi:ParB family chromosome partitioning protein
VVGLGQPLITDQAYRLIAGSHRLAAIQQLKAENPKLFKQHFPEGLIPLRVYTFDSLAEPERSQQIEIAENEKRRDYTPAEVKALAQKYLAQGYSHGSHRPKGGEKPLIPALQTYFRLSRRTIQRYLSSSNEPYKQSEVEISASGDALTPKARKIRRYIHSLKQIRAFLKHENQKGERSLSHVIEQLELLLQTQQD